MGKASGIPVAIVRGLDPTWFREGPTVSLSGRRTRTCSGDDGRTVPAFIEARRSIRAFRPEPVDRAVLDPLVEAACIAPAPHHSRPWRFVVVDGPDASGRLPTAWVHAGAPTSPATASPPTASTSSSTPRTRSSRARRPLVLGCLTWDGLDRYPDEARQRAEWGMALLSLGAAVENLMLAAADRGLASCWVAAPIFCPEAARDALELPDRVAPPRARDGRPTRPRLRRPRPPTRPPRRPPHLPPVAFLREFAHRNGGELTPISLHTRESPHPVRRRPRAIAVACDDRCPTRGPEAIAATVVAAPS